MVRLKTIIKPISQKTESEIIKLLSLSPPTCYARTDENLINNISSKLFVSKSLVTSAKSAHIKNKMIKNHHHLESNINTITKMYEKQCIPILKLSEKCRIGGTCEFKRRELKYQDKGQGSFEDFSGKEEIFVNDKSVYNLNYQMKDI